MPSLKTLAPTSQLGVRIHTPIQHVHVCISLTFEPARVYYHI